MLLSFQETLHGTVRNFHPPARRPVHLYVCGPTVYDRAHVGHARTYLYFDIVRRFLEAGGHRVRYVMNVTDFEDKITHRASALRIPWRTLARREERSFFRDLEALGIEPPTSRPRASDYVPEMIGAIRRLERAGLVDHQGSTLLYAPRRNVCTRNFPLGRDLENHLVPDTGAPPLPSDGTAAGFVLWRPQELPNPVWPSPWGRGAPGWHLECYVMAHRLLGLPVDLHGGGADLRFPHHFTENEVACSLDGTLFSRSFLHLPFVTQNGEKMSKSTGNLISVADALAAGDADGLRWYLLGTASTERLEWSSRRYAAAGRSSHEVRTTFREAMPDGAGGTASVRGLRALRRAVTRDVAREIGVDRAFRRIERYARDLGRRAQPRYPKGSRGEVKRELVAIDRLLGVHLTPTAAASSSARRSD